MSELLRFSDEGGFTFCGWLSPLTDLGLYNEAQDVTLALGFAFANRRTSLPLARALARACRLWRDAASRGDALAEMRWRLQSEALCERLARAWAAPHVRRGVAFPGGNKAGVSTLTKWITKALNKTPSASARDLWEEICECPPNGLVPFINRHGEATELETKGGQTAVKHTSWAPLVSRIRKRQAEKN